MNERAVRANERTDERVAQYSMRLVLNPSTHRCFRTGAKPEDAEIARFVDVRDGGHGGLEDDLGVVLEEVDLQRTVGEMEDDGGACSEPRSQERETNLEGRLEVELKKSNEREAKRWRWKK